jgi:hypothetical protein
MNEQIKDELKRYGKSIREAAGVKDESITFDGVIKKLQNFGLEHKHGALTEEDRQQAQLELAYLRSAITLAEESNAVACVIKIGPFELGVCDNKSIIPVLLYNINEIEKYLRGEPNSYE